MRQLLLKRISKIKNNKSLINGSLFSIYSFVNQGVSFLLLIILAGFIMPDDYGRLNLFNTVVMFLSYFVAFSTQGYVGISYFKNDEQEFKKTFTAIISLALISFLFFLILIVIILLLFKIDFGFPSRMLWLAASISFLVCIFQIYLDLFRVREKVKFYGVISCGNAILNLLLTLLLVITLNLGWKGWVEAKVLCALLFSMFAVFYFIKSHLLVSQWWSKERINRLLLWGIPLIPHLASTWLRQGCDRYIINSYHSTYEVGLFSFSLNLASVIVMIGVAFNQTNSVSIFKLLSNNEILNRSEELKKKTKLFFGIYLFSTIFVTVLLSVLVPFLLPNYTGSLSYFYILSVYGFLQCMYFLYSNYLFYYEQTRNLMYITFGSSLLHLALSLMFTQYSMYYLCVLYVIVQLTVLILVIKKSKSLLNSSIVRKG